MTRRSWGVGGGGHFGGVSDAIALVAALRTWQAAATGEAAAAAQAARREAEATVMVVRRCYATDKLGMAVSASAVGQMRRAWFLWWLCACAIDGEQVRSPASPSISLDLTRSNTIQYDLIAPRQAADEADRLRDELAEELRQNASLQQVGAPDA